MWTMLVQYGYPTTGTQEGETLEPQDKRRQSAILDKVLALQDREREADANGLAGLHGEEKKRAS